MNRIYFSLIGLGTKKTNLRKGIKTMIKRSFAKVDKSSFVIEYDDEQYEKQNLEHFTKYYNTNTNSSDNLTPGFCNKKDSSYYQFRALNSKEVNEANFNSIQEEIKLTSIGIGTYKGDIDQTTDLKIYNSIIDSVNSGCLNVIDTGIHFRYQKSERAVGAAIKHLQTNNYIDIKRGELFVCSRVGHLQEDGDFGVSQETTRREMREMGVKDKEVVNMNCYNEEFISYQQEKSRRNQGLETIDQVMMHNPENFLTSISEKEENDKMQQADVYELIGKGMRRLEDERKNGKQRFYGISSYAAFREFGKYYLSLEKLVEIAEKYCGKENGFKFINLPINIVMPESFIEKTQTYTEAEEVEGGNKEPTKISTLKLADKLKLNVFATSPLLSGYLMQTPLPSDIFHTRYIGAKHVNFIRSLPFDCIKSVIIGMKRNRHVKMNLQVTHVPKASTDDFDEFIQTPRLRMEQPDSEQFAEEEE